MVVTHIYEKQCEKMAETRAIAQSTRRRVVSHAIAEFGVTIRKQNRRKRKPSIRVCVFQSVEYNNSFSYYIYDEFTNASEVTCFDDILILLCIVRRQSPS